MAELHSWPPSQTPSLPVCQSSVFYLVFVCLFSVCLSIVSLLSSGFLSAIAVFQEKEKQVRKELLTLELENGATSQEMRVTP